MAIYYLRRDMILAMALSAVIYSMMIDLRCRRIVSYRLV
ncbi:hypothetical protein OROHE_004577 [Orobanche hederae]